jgi:hypothetical protein
VDPSFSLRPKPWRGQQTHRASSEGNFMKRTFTPLGLKGLALLAALLAPKDAEAPGLGALAAAGDLFAPDNV